MRVTSISSLKKINLSTKINAYLVVGSEKRWLAWQEQKEESLENFFKRYPALKDNSLYKKKWGKARVSWLHARTF